MRCILVFVSLLVTVSYSQSIPADANKPAASVQAAQPMEAFPEMTLPPKDSIDYWVLRSDAVEEFIPFLTKKRSELKTRLKLMGDYLLQIDKASDFANQNTPITFDSNVYAEVLRITPGLQQMKVPMPKERPTWDQLVEVAMQHVLYEGYLPAVVEDAEKQQYVEICKKKEEYGQKVRTDMRKMLDQCARIWCYLDKTGQLGAYKSHEADLILQQKADAATKRAAMMQEKQQAALARAEDQRQSEYEQRMAREEFRSSRRERIYDSRQDQLLYRQSRLDERYANSRAYYY
ncbi:MAG: hypothetical protein LLF76_10990 [Planctomycetaceae bacterium]|nr:hypothetical protein [Planctomycetaceae bacterium]